jgi:quercetin dioxygenase-like cupin family protein
MAIILSEVHDYRATRPLLLPGAAACPAAAFRHHERKFMKVIHGRASGIASENRKANCTGAVWGDPVLPTTDGVTVNNVFFTPGGRTHWHTHEAGQLLQVTAGSGWVCSEGGEPQRIRTGDLVWIAPGERHWHGADAESYLLHLAISIGKTSWQEGVSDEQYGAQSPA